MPTNSSPRLIVVCSVLFVVGCGNSTERLIAQLGDADLEIRRAAAHALAEQSDEGERVVAALSTASRDPDIEVKEVVITSLGSMGSRATTSLPALEQSLLDSELSVRVAAALAIEKIDPRSKSYVPVFTESLRAGHGPVFLEVGRMGTDAEWAVPTLVALLSDRRASIRALAADTLGKIGVADGNVKAALERSLRDDSPGVRKAAQRALEQTQGKNRG